MNQELRNSLNSSSGALPLVSIVIIGRNEGERLRESFAALARIDSTGFENEVIYVDSGSTDHSLQIAAEFGIRTIALNPENPTAAIGRNAGWRASRGEYVLFLDGDSAVEPGFIREALSWFCGADSDPMLAVLFGVRRERYPKATFFNRVYDLDWVKGFGLVEFCGGDGLVRRIALEQVDGFDDALIAGEDADLCRRIRGLGYKVRCVDTPMSLHDLNMTSWSQYWKRSTRTGHAVAEVSTRYRDTADPLWMDNRSHTMKRAVAQVVVLITVCVSAIVLRSLWPVAVLALLAVLLVLNTMRRNRHRTDDLVTLLLYSIHGHVQQIPIAVGQLSWSLRPHRTPRLIEYK